jgi:hypothetical protein
MATRPKHLKTHPSFPRLKKANNKVESDDDAAYNCIAFAAGFTDRKLWPWGYPDYVWPKNIPVGDHVDSFIKLFENYGYSETIEKIYVNGIDRIAIYAKNGKPKHAAIQSGPNKWKSKLGGWYDIEHSLDAISGGDYGEIAVFMERKKN